MRVKVLSARSVAFVIAAMIGLVAGPAAAQSAAAQKDESPLTESDQVQRARVHYDRGLQLFNEGNLDAAALEFARAYELAPSYKLLYNMGVIQRQQNNYVLALQNYRRYLLEGGANVPAERKEEVEKEIAVLRPRVAEVTLRVNVDGAALFLDDAPVCGGIATRDCIGTSPMRDPVLMNPGRHKITAQKRGYSPGTALISVVGSDTSSASVDLVRLVQKDRPTDPGPRNRALVSWGATALLAGGSVAAGVLALGAQSKLNDDKNVVGQQSATLNSDSTNVKTLSLVTDIVGGVAIVGAVISVFLTVKAVRAGNEAERQRQKQETAFHFDICPTGATVFGRF